MALAAEAYYMPAKKGYF